MYVRRMKVENLRNLAAVDLEFSPSMNVLTGPNGAGKTSLLEAVYLLGHAESFRSGGADTLIRFTGGELSVFAEIGVDEGRLKRVGLQREAKRWLGRIDGRTSKGLAELLRETAVVCFDPGSHALIGGASELRRRFLDWSVFHVEPDFYATAQSYRRALKQRNALLRARGPEPQLLAWDEELVIWGERVDAARSLYMDRWAAQVVGKLDLILPELGVAKVRFSRGWKDGASLGDALLDSRGRDRERGFSHVGAHRANWGISFVLAPDREYLSRGQEKLCALACVMAQAEVRAELVGDWPIICVDDLASELDQTHQMLVIRWFEQSGAQVFVSGTEPPQALGRKGYCLFHVEQGKIARVL